MPDNTPITAARVDPDLLAAVRERHGLAAAPVSTVLRYALALAAGRDPQATAYVPMGPKPRRAAA